LPYSPPDDDEIPSLRRGFGAAFWIALAFGFACVLAGLAFALFGSRLFAI
jgi:hypothetical protein